MDAKNQDKIKPIAFRIVKVLILILVVLAMGRVIYKAWLQYAAMETKPTIQWDLFILAALVYQLALVPLSLFFHRLLTQFRQQPTVWESVRAHICGHVGKYIPGKALVVIIRTALVQSNRTNSSVAAAAAFLETLSFMAVGGLLSCAFLSWVACQTGNYYLVVGAVAVLLAAGLPTIPPVFLWIVQKIGKSKIAAGLNDIQHLPASLLIFGWFMAFLCWFGFAVSYWLVLQSIGIDGPGFWRSIPQLIGVVAFAVSAGFMILVLPGGLGVRDLAFIGLMQPWLETLHPGSGLALATMASVLLRLNWLAAECSIAVVLYLIGTRNKQS